MNTRTHRAFASTPATPPVSRVSLCQRIQLTAVSVTLNHTRHLLSSAYRLLGSSQCNLCRSTLSRPRSEAGLYEVEVDISPVHL